MPPRYRCTACGNLTRFDVTTTRRTRAFHHYTIGGELEIEDEEELFRSVDEVSCRWCGNGRSVEELDPESDSADLPEGAVPVDADPSVADPSPSSL